MDEILFSISVEGLERAQWEPTFGSSLAKELAAGQLSIYTDHGAGTLAEFTLCGYTGFTSRDDAVRAVTIVLSALSLAVSSAQLALKLHESSGQRSNDPPAITCRIEGPNGTRELRVENAGLVPDSLVRRCLSETGQPIRIRAKANAKP